MLVAIDPGGRFENRRGIGARGSEEAAPAELVPEKRGRVLPVHARRGRARHGAALLSAAVRQGARDEPGARGQLHDFCRERDEAGAAYRLHDRCPERLDVSQRLPDGAQDGEHHPLRERDDHCERHKASATHSLHDSGPECDNSAQHGLERCPRTLWLRASFLPKFGPATEPAHWSGASFSRFPRASSGARGT